MHRFFGYDYRGITTTYYYDVGTYTKIIYYCYRAVHTSFNVTR